MMGQPVPLKKNVNEKPSNIQKIQLEDWVSISTFEFYVRYIYTGKLSLDINEEEPNLELHEQHESVTESHEDGGE